MGTHLASPTHPLPPLQTRQNVLSHPLLVLHISKNCKSVLRSSHFLEGLISLFLINELELVGTRCSAIVWEEEGGEGGGLKGLGGSKLCCLLFVCCLLLFVIVIVVLFLALALFLFLALIPFLFLVLHKRFWLLSHRSARRRINSSPILKQGKEKGKEDRKKIRIKIFAVLIFCFLSLSQTLFCK